MSDILHLHQDGSYSFPPEHPGDLPELPGARQPIHIRPAVLSDYDFIDDLQKKHKEGVGFMWEKAIKGHIEKGNVLVAEAARPEARGVRHEEEDDSPNLNTHASSLKPIPAGYVLGVDRYLKRDELGIIYQMNVAPEFQRSLVAANLLKAKFERSAYGCRLYCCWCAQDLAANQFWEAMGFVPLAFRTGGGRRRKDGPRMHIFWQKRIREGDTGDVANGGTAYWFPSITGAGAIGEDRIVLPIPPGTHWSDAKPIVLPNGPSQTSGGDEVKLLESEVQRLERSRKQTVKQKKAKTIGQIIPPQSVELGGLRFGSPTPSAIEREATQQAEAAVNAELKEAKRAVKAAKKKFDPTQVAFARELKDRWLEQVLAEPHLIAPTPGSEKYAVGRRIEPTSPMTPRESTSKSVSATGGLKITDAKRLDAA